jgi:large subunit ribosomal protein L31
MKATGHPIYYPDAVVKCACGNTFTTGSTKPTIDVEICAACHPFFTGEMRFVDTLGRVEKFQKKASSVSASSAMSKKQKQVQKKKEEDAAEAARPKSLKEMLDRVKQGS